MRKGTVKQFDSNSAYGFIEDDHLILFFINRLKKRVIKS